MIRICSVKILNEFHFLKRAGQVVHVLKKRAQARNYHGLTITYPLQVDTGDATTSNMSPRQFWCIGFRYGGTQTEVE